MEVHDLALLMGYFTLLSIALTITVIIGMGIWSQVEAAKVLIESRNKRLSQYAEYEYRKYKNEYRQNQLAMEHLEERYRGKEEERGRRIQVVTDKWKG